MSLGYVSLPCPPDPTCYNPTPPTTNTNSRLPNPAPPSTSSLTAAVLMRAMVTLNHQMSPPQHALLCVDERRSALQQLIVTTETAAKLADVAHVEALTAQCKAAGGGGGGGADRTTAETERLHAESAKIGREVERVVAETERTRAETEKVGKETEKMCKEIERAARETLRLKVEAEAKRAREEVAAAQETEDNDGEMDKGMSETEQQTATTPPAASSSRQRGRLGVPRGRTQPSQRRRSPSHSPPASVLPPEEGIKIVALYEDNEMVEEIEDALEEWNSNNREQFTLAGWAWFMHSETEAYVFLDRPGKDAAHVRRPIRDRTGTIKTPRSMFRDLDIYKGYDGYIYGSRKENRKRERVKFE
ncbi:hypothetical protein DFP73DRAFT_567199 [Morchella snyderi]|nr:hypothetical protein DFP73DRAFT_567199 [Morchella snyderi]